MNNFWFLLTEGGADATGGAPDYSWIGSLILIAVVILVFWLFMIRPQKKQEQKDNEMRNSLAVGDEVTTIGGIIGKVVSVKAEKNEALLQRMVEMDENAGYLGECALVPKESPINQSGLIFYNTLFDENASCHLALGMGYDNCVKDFEKYTREELEAMGVNDSVIHVDFMIGTDDMEITGITAEGEEIAIFRNGTWAF
jgi:preprotein translocase YajC subunit